MSTYTLIQPNVHLICNPLVRSSLEIEVILTSGGSWFEAEADRGRKHLMEHCIASRTADMDFITFKNYQFRENIMINAYTSQNSLAVTAKTHASKFTQALEKVLEMAITPTFDNDILTQEREIVLREISERRGSPDYKLHFWTMDQICQPGSADTHEVLGSSEQVALTTLGDMIRLQHQNLEQSNLIVIVSGGSVDESEATRIINEILNKAENPFIQSFAKTETKNPITFQPPNKLKSFQLQPLVHELAHEHADVSIFIPCTVGLENLATQNVFKELFLNYYGVIYHRLRDELGYIYSLHSSFLFNTQMLELNLSCELQYVQPILDEIKKHLSDWQSYFDAQKMQEFKSVATMKLEMSGDSLGSEPSFIVSNLRKYGVVETLTAYLPKLQNTTEQQVQELYQNLEKNLDKMQVVVVSKDEKVLELV